MSAYQRDDDDPPAFTPRPRRDLAVVGDGQVMISAGKYARQCVLTAFEMLGGVEALADWGARNKTDFYTKIFTKTITREVEADKRDNVESFLDELDGKLVNITPEADDDIPVAPSAEPPRSVFTPAPGEVWEDALATDEDVDVDEFYD